jgi:DNA-directed RNA polymerase specialized sigma24 family protein
MITTDTRASLKDSPTTPETLVTLSTGNETGNLIAAPNSSLNGADQESAQNSDQNWVEQLPTLYHAARLAGVMSPQRSSTMGTTLSPAHLALVQTLQRILEQPVDVLDLQGQSTPQGNDQRVGGTAVKEGGSKEGCRSYLRQLIQAYYCLFPKCLAGVPQASLSRQALAKTVQRIVQIPVHVIQEDYDRLNRTSYNQALKQLVIAFSRPELLRRATLPPLTEGECLLALFLQFLRQQMGEVVLFSDAFTVEYRDLLRSMAGANPETDLCQNSLISWLWEAMRSFDPLKAFSAAGHGRTTFEAWVRTVVSNKLADEKRKLLKREADELLFYEARALQMFHDRFQALPSAVQAELDRPACLTLIQLVQTEITDPRVRASTNRLRQRLAERSGWTLAFTREIHQQVRRVLGRYVQSTRSLNITSTDSNQEWIDNYPDVRTIASPETLGLDCMTEFLHDAATPIWVQDWCERRRTQAEIAKELFVSQPTISRCLSREYRLWLYRKFFQDALTPAWMKQWHDTQSIASPHRRRQLRREIYPRYAQGIDSAKAVDGLIESKLSEWCNRNGIQYLY